MKRLAVLLLVTAGCALTGCSSPVSAPPPSTSPPSTPATAAAVRSTEPTQSPAATAAPASDGAFLADLRRKEPTLAKVRDETLVAAGKDFCAQVRAGAPARSVMQTAVDSIAAKYQSGQITSALQDQMVMASADTDETATVHYCPEQMTQVTVAFAAMAGGR